MVLLIIWSMVFNRNDHTGPSLAYTRTELNPTAISSSKAVQISPIAESSDENTDQENNPMIVPTVETTDKAATSLSTDSFLDSVARVLDSQDQLMAAVDVVYRKSFLYTKRSYKTAKPKGKSNITATWATSQVNNKPRTIPVTVNPVHQQVHLQSRYIRDGNKQNLSGVEVMVKNNSRKLLKSVSVDVFYFKKGEHLIEKETVYLNNIHPHQSLTMLIPGNRKAISARMQLGTITMAEKY